MLKFPGWLDPAFEAIVIDDEGRACSDIPDEACQDEAGNFFTHVTALALSKSADSLVDPKLVLSWLMPAVGTPPALVGLLVPIREAGALLPQMFTAGTLRRLPQRKWAWSAGAAVQGMAAIAIAVSSFVLSGISAGIAILASLTILSLARSVCSVCYKDVLGKTVDKSRRGRATGLASSLAATVTVAFALTLFWGDADRYDLVVGAICLAGALWVLASIIFLGLTERSGATDGGANAFKTALDNLTYVKSEPQLRVFILTRGLLTATAFAPPFMVALAAGGDAKLSNLAFLVAASALAALCSSFIWGKLADRSSRKVLSLSAMIGMVSLLSTAAISMLNWIHKPLVLPFLLFCLMIGYQGVRLGRSTHLVDMTSPETRAAFTALSNTAIGLILLLGGGFSFIANWAGLDVVITILAAMCSLAIVFAHKLEEVQRVE